jgi:hypothetical protein
VIEPAPASATVHRGTVANLTPGWKALALPLDASNDDETPPFPVTSQLGARTDDPQPARASLVLYRVLLDGALDAGNVLWIGKNPVGAGLRLWH